jgi:hypothetical protein
MHFKRRSRCRKKHLFQTNIRLRPAHFFNILSPHFSDFFNLLINPINQGFKMKLSVKLLVFFCGVLLVSWFSCQSKNTPENVSAPKRVNVAIPEAEEKAEINIADERFAEFEEKLAQRTAELREVEVELHQCQTRLDTLEKNLAEQNEILSGEISGLKQMNQFAWVVAAVLLIVLLGGWFRSRRKTR